MTIVMKKLRWKNFLSTGNVFTELDLTKSSNTLITGKNGSGKSSVCDALVYVLYNKPFRKINKPQLINSINQKDCLVELEFSIGKHDYFIRRGMKPNIFEIYRDGNLINQDAASKDYQSYLEETILKINFKSFTQVVILGSAIYVPFMELTPQGRREVIEDLLDIQIFSTMNVLHKEKLSKNKELLLEQKHQLDIYRTKIESAEKHNETIKRMKLLELDKLKEKTDFILRGIEEDQEKINLLQLELENLVKDTSDKTKTQSKHDMMIGIKSDLIARKNLISKTLSFYNENDTCPTCNQHIDNKQSSIEEHTCSLTEVLTGISDLDTKLETVFDRLSQIKNTETSIQQKLSSIGEQRTKLILKKSTLDELNKDRVNAEKEVKEVDFSEILGYTETLRTIEKEYEVLLEERELMSYITLMLKDGGIKTRIIRQYVPVMNKLINKYLSLFDLFVDFQLDENFNEVIKSRFRDTFSYASFSEGEKLKISLAIMLTWRAISKLRNSVSTNLLIMDEVLDGAADTQSVDVLIELLSNMGQSDNIYVISHRGHQFEDKFENHIEFEKVKNFSQIANR